jgi:hypothetical protein
VRGSFFFGVSWRKLIIIDHSSQQRLHLTVLVVFALV